MGSRVLLVLLAVGNGPLAAGARRADQGRVQQAPRQESDNMRGSQNGGVGGVRV